MDDYGQLLWPSEKRKLIKRQQIVDLLKEGNTVRKIAKQLKVSTATVQRVKRLFKTVPVQEDEQRSHPTYVFGQEG